MTIIKALCIVLLLSGQSLAGGWLPQLGGPPQVVGAPPSYNSGLSSDANLVAWYRMESGGITTDSTGDGNTLSTTGTVAANTSTYVEGSAAAEFSASSQLDITDSNLAAGFPGKDGSTANSISIGFWYRPGSISGFQGLVGKYASSQYSFAVINSSGSIFVRTSNNGDASAYYDVHNLSSVFTSTSTWYYVVWSYDASTTTANSHLKVWDGSTWIVDDTKNTNDHPDGSTSALTIGDLGTNTANVAAGTLIDELVIFNDVLSDTEMNALKGGTY